MDGCEESFLFEGELLHHEAVGGGHFEHAAGDLAGFGDRGEVRAGGVLPGLGVRLGRADLGVAFLLDQLGDDVGHLFWLAAEEPATLQLPAAVEVVEFFGIRINHKGTKDTKDGTEPERNGYMDAPLTSTDHQGSYLRTSAPSADKLLASYRSRARGMITYA